MTGRLDISRRRFLSACGQGLLGCSLVAGPGRRPTLRAAESDLDQATRAAIDKGLAYLAARQNDDGSFGNGGYSRNVAICGLCGMAFLADGHVPHRGTYGLHVDRCVEFILRHTEENGYIFAAEGSGRGPMYGHGFALLFLAEVYGTARNEAVRKSLESAVRLVVNTQNAEGGWRYEPRRSDADVSVTVCQVVALRAAHNAGIFVPKETIERAVAYIKRCQNPDGGFMYQAGQPSESLFPRSAAAVVALYSAGIYEGEELRKGLDFLLQSPPRVNARGDQSYYFYGHYYAAQAMWQAGGRYWETWYPAVRGVLLEQQRSDGSWYDAINPEYGTAMAVLVLHLPSSYLPIFQR